MARVPKYCRHPNGQAYVQYRKKRYYLGKYDTPGSRQKYRQFLKRIEAASPAPATPSPVGDGELTILALVEIYLNQNEAKFSRDESGIKELASISEALERLCDLDAFTPGCDYGSLRLLAFQDYLKDRGSARSYINAHVGRVKRFVRWCAARELIPEAVFRKAQTVENLRFGDGGRETEKIGPADPLVVKATLPWVSPIVAALIKVQWLCGMRPGEALQMRGAEIKRDHEIWLYMPEKFKTRRLGQVRVTAIPRAAQDVLRPLLEVSSPTDFIFSPAVSRKWHFEQMRSKRKTRVQPSQQDRSKRNPKRQPGSRYSTNSYRRAIHYARQKAAKDGFFIPHWHPHQLRHGIATFIAQSMGQQAAQRWLGHASIKTTDIYVERQVCEIIEIAKGLDQVWSWG